MNSAAFTPTYNADPEASMGWRCLLNAGNDDQNTATYHALLIHSLLGSQLCQGCGTPPLSQPCGLGKKSRGRKDSSRLKTPSEISLQAIPDLFMMADTVDSRKKRKRNTEDSSNLSKKVTIEEDRKVKISLKDGDEWTPVIALTPGVSLPTSIPLISYTRLRRNAQRRAGGPIATTELLLHSNTQPKLDYTAREEETAGSNPLLKHYVGVYDPESGKLEVMEARKMVVRGVVRAHQATAEDQVASNLREQRSNLGQAFGTKKAKKAIASVTENAISSKGGQPAKMDLAAQAMIASMAKDTEGMASRDQLAAEAEASKPRPKAELGATNIKDVYTVENLIGLDILKVVPVLDWQQDIKAKKEIIVRSEYVAHRIQNVSASPEKLRILRYLLLLIDLHMSSKPQRFGGTKLLPRRDEIKRVAAGMPEAVIENARRNFSSNGIMSKYQIDLLTTHICALACMVDNFTVDMYDLQADLRLDTKGMSQYFHEIGARTTALPEQMRKDLGLDRAMAAQRKIAKLKLPLEFPRVPFVRRRK